MKSSITKKWYVLKTKAYAEKKVYANLLKKDFDVFLPLIETIRQWSDRKKKVQVPLIPSIVFIKCNPCELSLLYGEIGISRVLQYLNKPAVVKDFEIENLKILVNELRGEDILFQWESLLPGQAVEVIDGPFMGLVAESIVLNGKHRIKVKINALNREFIVNIPCSSVRAISSQIV